MNNSLSVVILAAGLGTRMRSRRAKVLHEAGGLSLVEHVIRAASSVASPENITVVTGHQAEQVEDRLRPYGVGFARQTEQRGTGHAVLCCAEQLSRHTGYVLVLYGDCPLLEPSTLRALFDAHGAEGNPAATILTTNLPDPAGYGRIVRNDRGRVHAIVEEKAATPDQKQIREINSGIYCFNARPLWEELPKIDANPASGEFYLTDIVERLNAKGEDVAGLVIEDAAQILGINHRVELAEADRVLRERKARQLMLAGVTIENPSTVAIDVTVEIGIDTIIEPFCRITGNTAIGEDCQIGAGSIIENSRLSREVRLKPYTLVADSVIESQAQLGPFTRLRLENHVGAGANIGNFVELKKTRLGDGSKAMHLAYLGDSEIGAKANIGAGTITCNYDGVKKHTTLIGDGAFVGSNSTLVAPVSVGNRSYVGAGSVITDPVPEDALALGRSRQSIKNGWAARRRRETVRK